MATTAASEPSCGGTAHDTGKDRGVHAMTKRTIARSPGRKFRRVRSTTGGQGTEPALRIGLIKDKSLDRSPSAGPTSPVGCKSQDGWWRHRVSKAQVAISPCLFFLLRQARDCTPDSKQRVGSSVWWDPPPALASPGPSHPSRVWSKPGRRLSVPAVEAWARARLSRPRRRRNDVARVHEGQGGPRRATGGQARSPCSTRNREASPNAPLPRPTAAPAPCASTTGSRMTVARPVPWREIGFQNGPLFR